MFVSGATLAVAIVVLAATVDVVDNDDAVSVVVVDDVCAADEAVDGVMAVLSLAGFGELTGLGLSTLRGLAAVSAGTAAPFVFGSVALVAMDGAVVVVVAVVAAMAFAVDAWLLAAFSFGLAVPATSFSSLIMVMLLFAGLPFEALYDNVLMATNGFGGGCSVTCGDVCMPFWEAVAVDAVLPIDIIVTVGRLLIDACCCWLAAVC